MKVIALQPSNQGNHKVNIVCVCSIGDFEDRMCDEDPFFFEFEDPCIATARFVLGEETTDIGHS